MFNRVAHLVIMLLVMVYIPTDTAVMQFVSDALVALCVLHLFIGKGFFLSSMFSPLGVLFMFAYVGLSINLPLAVISSFVVGYVTFRLA